MNKERINALIEKYFNGTSSQEETALVEKWLESRSKQSEWNWKDKIHQEKLRQEIFKNIDNIVNDFQPIKRKSVILVYQRAIAALLILSLAFGFWFLVGNKENNQESVFNRVVKPGTKAAILQMGNGETIYLDDREEGTLSHFDNVEINKRKGGVIQYTTSAGTSNKAFENTLFIPRGGQYQITLSDGTNVWLNSETKLIYPSRFVGEERKVKLIGEAYFKVAKNVNQPFIVESEGMDILVTGTEFNVSAYKGASETMTTLIEGSVEASNNDKEKIKLIPGQQAYQKIGGSEFGKRQVDVDMIISWRKGYFSFDYQNLEEVMNHVSRWYDIDYKIIGKPERQEKLGGTFSKDKSLEELLAYLEQLVNVKITKKERSVTIIY